MPLTLVWGTDFVFESRMSSTGTPYSELFGVDGGSVGISWVSIRKMMELARVHGIPDDLWPVFPDCDLDSSVPLREVRVKSDALRDAIASVPADVIEHDYWLKFIENVLRQGHALFVMA